MNNLLKKSPTRWLVPVLLLLFAAAVFAFFQSSYPYHFFYQEQNQLFLLSTDWLSTYFSKPAWLACMVGDFLTQFYYYLYAGAAILSVCLLLVGLVMFAALRQTGINRPWLLALLSLGAMAAEAAFSLDYDFRLSAVLCVAGGALLFVLCGRIGRKIAALAEALVFLVGMGLAFWCFGHGMLVFACLSVLRACLDRRRLCLRLGSLLLPLCLAPFAKHAFLLDYVDLLAYPMLPKLVAPQMELEQIFAVDNEYYFGHYDKVVAMVEAKDAPSKNDLFYYNLVKAQRHELPDVLMKFSNNYLGTFESLGPSTPTLTLKRINELYWVLGDMTFAERAAMLAMVCSPEKRNIRMVKRSAEINLTSGDTLAARKYLRILQKTFVWRGWAGTVMDALDNPHSQNEGILKYYQEKGNLINRADTLRLSDNARILLQELVESNPENRVALDYLLCSDLLLKDMESFKRDYDRFCHRMENPPYDVKLYQEALMIYLAGTNASPDEWMKYIHRKDVMEQFKAYNGQRGSSLFRGTYWYYFDKATTPKLNRK